MFEPDALQNFVRMYFCGSNMCDMLVKGNIKTCYYGWKKDYLNRKMYKIIKLQTLKNTSFPS